MVRTHFVSLHHRFTGHELGQTPGDGEGQTGKPGVWLSTGSPKVGCDLVNEQQQQIIPEGGEAEMQCADWEKIFANDLSDEDLASGGY